MYTWPVPFRASTAVRWPAFEPPLREDWEEVRKAARGEGRLAGPRGHATHAQHTPAQEATPASRKRAGSRAPAGTYSESAQRKKRKASFHGGYVEDPKRKEGAREIMAIEMSPYALAAVVAGAYEWRDGALPPTKAARKRRIW